jgi:hypothetical protein
MELQKIINDANDPNVDSSIKQLIVQENRMEQCGQLLRKNVFTYHQMWSKCDPLGFPKGSTKKNNNNIKLYCNYTCSRLLSKDLANDIQNGSAY